MNKNKIMLSLLIMMSTSVAFAQGYPGGPPVDPCNATYDGSFQYGGGPLTITFERSDAYNHIAVTSNFRGFVVYGDGVCDNRSVSYRLDDVHFQSGRFFYGPYGLESLSGTQFINGRPYQGFIVYPR